MIMRVILLSVGVVGEEVLEKAYRTMYDAIRTRINVSSRDIYINFFHFWI